MTALINIDMPHEAQILEAIRLATIEAVSPWKNRTAAAAYTGWSLSKIDQLAAEGKLKSKPGPRFRTKDLDALMESGEWRKAA